MTITPIDWPAVLKPQSFGYFPIHFDISGGAAPDGTEQFVSSPGPSWGASMILLVRSNAELLALRALRMQTRGRAIPVNLPNFDGQRLSWPLHPQTGEARHPGRTRDRRLDGTPFENPEIPAESEIIAELSASAALRATTIGINITQGGALVPGQQFQLGASFCEIATIASVAGSITTVTFQPPLRASASAGDAIIFTTPTHPMRIMNLNEAFREVELLRFVPPLSLEFAEFF